MSDIARFNLILSLAIFAIGISLFEGIHPPKVTVPTPVASPFCATPLPSPDIVGKAGVVYDVTHQKVLFQLNADAQLPLASITKVMTVLTSLAALSPNENIVIDPKSTEPEGDSGLIAGQTWKVRELIDYTLITSSNDGAHALALGASSKKGESYDDFIRHMNETASAIGMTQTYFLNDTGLDVSKNSPGAMSSAHDIALLLSHVLQKEPDSFTGSSEKETAFTVGSKKYIARNTNSISNIIPEVILSKTGFTDLAGGNLAVLFEPLPGMPVAVVVLGSTREEREQDVLRLTQYAKEVLKKDIACLNNGH